MLDEQRSVKLRQRLWGAAILIALAVIFLPLLLDGSGSESQYRRVESLRAEPPRVIDSNGTPREVLGSRQTPNSETARDPAQTLDVRSATQTGARIRLEDRPAVIVAAPSTASAGPAASSGGLTSSGSAVLADSGQGINVEFGGSAPQSRNPAGEQVARQAADPLTAWVVQAGSFEEQVNAIAVRDRLRRAGYPSFVSPVGTRPTLFRVRVGPMIDQNRALRTRDKVMSLLGREAIVMTYP